MIRLYVNSPEEFVYVILQDIIIVYSLEFFTSALADCFSLEFKWQHVSSSLQDSPQYSGRSQQCSSLDGLHLSPTSKSPSLFNSTLDTVPNAPIMIGIIVTFMFHIFFNSQARSRYLSYFSLCFSFILWSADTAKSTILQVLFFLFVDYYKV